MGAENLNPLDELNSLDQQVERVTDLNDLKPIFTRVDEIAKQNSDDFEVQLVAGDIKQHLVNRGTRLKAEKAASPAAAVPPPPTVRLTPGTMPPPPVSPSAPTVKLTPGAMPPPAGPPPVPQQSAPAAAPPPLPPQAPPPQAPPTQAIRPEPIVSAPLPPPVAPLTAAPKPPDSRSLDQKPPELTGSVRLMSSGQFAPPKPPAPEPPRPPAMPGAGAGPTRAQNMGAVAGPSNTGQQPPMAAPPKPPDPASKQPPSSVPPPPTNWRRPLILGALLGAIVSIALIAVLVNQARKRNVVKEKDAAMVDVDVSTTPQDASIRVNDQVKCNSPCRIPLAPGSYQVMAFLDGYDPATSPVNVAPGSPASVNLTLVPQPQTMRVLTDLDAGKIAFDDQPPADLQEGQFILDKVAPGPHTVRVTGKNNTDATFTFEIVQAKPPLVTGTVTTHNLVAVIVSSFGNHARVVTNTGPMKLAVNGQPEGDAGPAGVDLKTFQSGVSELIVGDGQSARNMKESFGPQPMLTAFLKSDLNIGTLIVSTGEDDVRVFINDKEYRRRTQRGQLRIPVIGNVSVRVAKNGFDGGPVQTAEVKKGAEVRLEFKLKAQPTTSTLQITGGTPGAEVLIDQKSVGTIGADGSLTAGGIAPGDHAVEIRREQYAPKRFTRSFHAGQPIAISGPEATLAAANVNGTVRIAKAPAEVRVTYRRADETTPKELSGNQIELPAGSYVFSASAPGYTTRNERVLLGAGETRTVELALTRSAPAPPVLKPGDLSNFEDASAWRKDGQLWTHRGGGFIPYGLGPKGIYTFTVELLHGGNVFRGGRVRWAVQWVDARNYLLFELDKKNFWAEVVENGKKFERAKTQHDLEKQKAFTVQIELTPEHVVHKIKNLSGDWITVDSFAEPGRNFTNGKFGFLIQGNDEIGISDFVFQPK